METQFALLRMNSTSDTFEKTLTLTDSIIFGIIWDGSVEKKLPPPKKKKKNILLKRGISTQNVKRVGTARVLDSH